MGLEELLEDIRNLYLESVTAELLAQQAEDDVEIIREPALRDDDGESVPEGSLGLPVRVDLAILRGGEIESLGNVEIDEMYDFEPVEFAWGDSMAVQLLPFPWDSASIVLPKGPAYDWTPLKNWFMAWFREEEDEADDDGPLGAVHFLSDPIEDEQSTILTVDLGSAPLEAFEQMLDAIEKLGVQEVMIGYTGHGNEPGDRAADGEAEELDEDFDDEDDEEDDEPADDDAGATLRFVTEIRTEISGSLPADEPSDEDDEPRRN